LTLFVTLADDTDKQIDLIDSRDLKRGSLADAQTARIHEKEPALVDGILDAPEDRANLCIREDVGQTLVLGRDMSCNAGLSSGLPDRIPQHLAVNRCTSASYAPP
jgi:hypothetical protein